MSDTELTPTTRLLEAILFGSAEPISTDMLAKQSICPGCRCSERCIDGIEGILYVAWRQSG